VDQATFGPIRAWGVEEVRHDLAALDHGFWAVVVTFEGAVTAIRFANVTRAAPSAGDEAWGGRSHGAAWEPARQAREPTWSPVDRAWTTSLGRTAYRRGVEEIRTRVAAGTVYQVNLCRVLSHALPQDADLSALATLLRRGNPAPHACAVLAPTAGVEVVCASPEAFLLRDGRRLASRPIKGTAVTRGAMLPKDYAENVMIVDLVRNDLSRVCRPGTVRVDHLCAPEEHPGLVHLVSHVSGSLRDGVGWPEIFAAAFPPGSVSGAPKSSALQAIADLEPVPRGPYCGAVGWVDAEAPDGPRAELAVGIRTFWAEMDEAGDRWLRFGAGAGVTWGSDPDAEWRETQLKAARLVGLASGRVTA
jgi:para-aminobenzoate synthetase component I